MIPLRTTGQRLLRQFCVVFTMLLMLAPPVVAAIDGASGCEGTWKFAEFLRKDGDYYRSITEYKRLLFECGSDTLASQAIQGIADSYFTMTGPLATVREGCRLESSKICPRQT